MFSLLSQTTKPIYHTYATLKGGDGPVNAIALSDDGKLLASGGDDELVRIWDIDEQRVVDVLSDRMARWGQITAIKWLGNMSLADSYTLCFGTGRGMLAIFSKVKDLETYKELTCVQPFVYNDPVEAMDLNHQGKLVVCSHSGRIAMYNLNRKGILEKAWARNLGDVENGRATIPRSVHFIPGGDSIIICGLESGIIFSKTITSGTDTWNKQIKSSIGSLRLSPNGSHLLVDNVTKGFDLYSYPSLNLSETFDIRRSQTHLHDGTFMEGSQMVSCGSDHGHVYIFSCKTSVCIQKVRIGTRSSTIQTIDAISSERYHFLAAGTSDERPEIIVWRKPVRAPRARTPSIRGCNLLMAILFFNAMILAAIFALLATEERGAKDGWIMTLIRPQGTPTVVEPAPMVPNMDENADEYLDQQAAEAMERYERRMLKKAVNLRDPDWRQQVQNL